MRLNARYRRCPLYGAVLFALLLLTGPGMAQDAAEPTPPQPVPAEAAEQGEDPGQMTIEIDLERLLFDARGGNFQDPVWRLQAGPGRRILLLPFTVDNINRPSKLSRFPINVRTGRFIGFVIPKPEQHSHGGNDVDLNRIVRAAPGELQQMLFESTKDDGAGEPEANNSPEEDAHEPTPEQAPRLARDIMLYPDGTVQWSMARSFHGGTAQGASESNPYGYKIDPAQLRATQPPKPERVTRNEGEDSRTFALRKREQQLAEREKLNAYRDLRDKLRRLPETFREPAPTVLYAAIEVPDSDTLSLQGPAPLPWVLDAEKKQLFEQLSRGNTLQNVQGEDLAGSIVALIQGHPLDARAVAIATTKSRLAGQVQTDDPGYQILSRLLNSNDIPTRRIALYGVATTNPPSIASAKLIGVAGEAALGEERKMLSFASLGKLFSTQADGPDTAQVLIDRVNETIADPEGPAAPRVIERVLDTINPGQITHGLSASDEATAVMIEAIDLTGVTPEEFGGVAEAIISRAPDSPVAAGWLDQQLLGSKNQDLINKTLSLLNESEIAPLPSEDQINPGTTDTNTDTESAPESDTTMLSGTIPMVRSDHALLALFDSKDDLQQAAAWAVLGRFHIALPGAERINQPGATRGQRADPARAMFESILAKAKAREEVPASIVAFIVNQKDNALTQTANDRFVALLADKDLAQKTARAALDAYFASPQRYVQSIQALRSTDKQSLMQAMYAAQDQQAPLMSGLIADRGQQAIAWLNTYAKEQGSLPTKDAWAELAVRIGEAELLRRASSPDPVLCSAAAAALVVAAGGDESQEVAFAQTIALMEARTDALVRPEWEKHRNKIYASAFKRAQDAYKLVATLVPANDNFGPVRLEPEEGEGAEPAPGKDIDLGVVEFRAEGVDLSLSVEAVTLSPSPGQLGIRIDQASTLRSFNKPELSRIPPEQLSQPIDLLPQDGGAWVGELTLRDGRVLRVSLEPAD
ncbi:MAG: hypothetical protein KTR15_15875 [Phycisphaeraceae bacterium]|nr:hypothetical protein [Phycisphaeraceae bacterium]